MLLHCLHAFLLNVLNAFLDLCFSDSAHLRGHRVITGIWQVTDKFLVG